MDQELGGVLLVEVEVVEVVVLALCGGGLYIGLEVYMHTFI